jgi:hypothetical protein
MSGVNGEAFDLDRVDVRERAEQGVEMELIDPAGEPTGVILLVRGYDSKTYKDVVEAQLRRRTAMLPRKPTEAESKEEFYEEHAALLAGWKGKTLRRGQAGQVVEYSAENAKALLKDYDFILEQVRRFAGARRNFLPGSVKS